MKDNPMKSFLAFILYVGMIVSIIGGWLTHIVVCIQAGAWFLLLAGAIFAPIGVVHGLSVWAGFNWLGG